MAGSRTRIGESGCLARRFLARLSMSLNPLLGAQVGRSFKDLDSTLKECIASFSHPEDPLAAWKNSFDVWIKVVKSFNEAEERNIYQEEKPDEVTWRVLRF